MNKNILLKENVIHGTKNQPIHALHFEMGKGKEYESGLLVQNHWHDHMEFLLIRKGSYQVGVNLETMMAKEGDLCIFNSGDLHQLRNLTEEAEHDALLFDPRICTFLYQDQWNQDTLVPMQKGSLRCTNLIRLEREGYHDLYSLMDQLFQIAFKEEADWYEYSKLRLLEIIILLKRYGLFIYENGQISQTDQKQILRYKEVVDYIESHYQSPISLKELSEVISCNEQYFCRFFKKISGITPIQYLIHYRIEQASIMLKEGDRSISEIALDCGFENISYFIKKFKEIMGMTPKEFKGMNI